jgi:hypothetical protein
MKFFHYFLMEGCFLGPVKNNLSAAKISEIIIRWEQKDNQWENPAPQVEIPD